MPIFSQVIYSPEFFEVNMQIFKSLEEVPKNQPVSLAIGNFDGVHLGHAKIINACKGRNSRLAILTFDIHPRAFLYPDFAPELLTLQREKYTFFKALGIDFVIELPFSRYFSMEPTAFLDLLQKNMKLEALTIGFNFFFGKNQKGNADLAFWWGRSASVKINVVQPFMKNGMRVSSTAIRELVLAGHIAQANSFSSFPFVISGEVKTGKKIGRTLNFPTINLETPPKIIPTDGVYLSQTVLDGHNYLSLTNIGNNPTIDRESNQKVIETWVDSTGIGELYGRNVTIYLLKRIRSEIRFSSKEKLAEMIAKDKAEIDIYKKSNKIKELPEVIMDSSFI